LWHETNPEARKIISNNKAAVAIREVQNMIRGSEFSGVSDKIREQLLVACDCMLGAMTTAATERTQIAPDVSATDVTRGNVTEERAEGTVLKPKSRSVLFGTVMGAIVACWVFSGNYIFTGLFTLMTILGQLEYYRMVISTGVYPARRISIVGACSMFLTALFTPSLHEICLPLFGLWAMIWFLTMKRSVTTIPEIATTFTGMFYLGYVPSFWVRIRLIGGGREPTRLAAIASPVLKFIKTKAENNLPAFIPQAIHLPITTGAIFIFWTWLCLAFSDVGAYFVGKNLGKTKLGKVAPAAGATSPNKTVEGVLGGCVVSGSLGILGK
jgi:CDP-diglyceride synthetase